MHRLYTFLPLYLSIYPSIYLSTFLSIYPINFPDLSVFSLFQVVLRSQENMIDNLRKDGLLNHRDARALFIEVEKEMKSMKSEWQRNLYQAEQPGDPKVCKSRATRWRNLIQTKSEETLQNVELSTLSDSIPLVVNDWQVPQLSSPLRVDTDIRETNTTVGGGFKQVQV